MRVRNRPRPGLSRIPESPSHKGVSTRNMSANAEFAECLACSCFAARRTARTITQHYEQHLKPTGLTATQFTLLALLAIGGPQPLSRFAGQLGAERTTLTRSLRPLRARGWVTE